jgi:Carbon-nitrogen hydrolase
VNAQAEYLWRVRALEAGVPAVAATKVGTESGVCTYAGRSQIIAADGGVVAIASATEAEVLVGEVEITEAQVATSHSAALPPTPVAPRLRAGHAYCVVVSDETLLSSLDGHGAALIVGPRGIVSAVDVTVEEVIGDAMLDPYVARSAAMRGAEFVAWIATDVSTPYVAEIALTRAMENRIFVPVWRPANVGGPFIAGPTGRLLASTPHPDRPYAVGAPCLLAEAATKQMAPGTDAWTGVAEIAR